MLHCLKKVGLKITVRGSCTTIHNSFPQCEKKGKDLVLQTGDGGTTNRFLIGLLARGKNHYCLVPSGKMKERPMVNLINILKSLGVDCFLNQKQNWYEVQGPAQIKKTLEVDCSLSTQFASALALMFADSNLSIELKNFYTSKNYYKMTEFLVSEFKKGRNNWYPEIDFSSLSYPLALGLLDGQVQVSNIQGVDSLQSDSIFLNIIEKMGGQIEWSKDKIKLCSPFSLKPLKLDVRNCLDLIPSLVFVCSYAQGVSQLQYLSSLKYKESNRLLEIQKILKYFYVDHNYDEKRDILIIRGPAPPVGFKTVIPPEDHRIVMLTYLFMRYNGGGLLYNSHCVKKSFPSFFEKMA